MAVHLITGFKGEEHIQSADQGSFNASFFGEGEFVMEAGNQCDASILDNNTVRVLDGDILMQGRHIRIPSNTYIDVNIKTGTAGVNRNDLIVMEYSKDANSGIETADLKMIQGVASEGTATDPSVATGDILGGATLNQMPLYRVKVEGVVLSVVEPMFTTIPTYKKLAEEAKKEFKESCENHLNSLNILDSKEEIEANTQANQLAGALAVKELSVNVENCFQSVSSGKALVASAITDKGVSTDATATFAQMATNINSIQTVNYKSLLGDAFTSEVSGYASIRTASSTARSAILFGVNSTAASAQGTGTYTSEDYYDLTDFNYLKFSGRGLVRGKLYAYIYLIDESGEKTAVYSKSDDGYGFDINSCFDISSYIGNYKVQIAINVVGGYTTPYINLYESSLLK